MYLKYSNVKKIKNQKLGGAVVQICLFLSKFRKKWKTLLLNLCKGFTSLSSFAGRLFNSFAAAT